MRYEPMREYELESIKREIEKALSSGSSSSQSASDAKRNIESAVQDLKRALSSLERNTDSRIRELQSASSSRSSYSSYESGIRDGRREADRAVSKIGDQLRNLSDGRGYSYGYSSGGGAGRKLDTLVDALKKANSELQTAGCQIDKLSKENDALRRKAGGLGSDMAKVAAGAAMASAKQANSELQAASRQIDMLTNENNALKRKVKELGSDIEKMSARTASSSASWQQEMRSARRDKMDVHSDETIHDENTETLSSDSRSPIERRNVVAIDHKVKDLIKRYEREISELRRENAHIKNQKPWFSRLLLIVLIFAVGAIIYFKEEVMLAVSHGNSDKTDVKVEAEAGPSIAKELGVQRFFDCDIGSKLGEEDGARVMDDGIYRLERTVSLEHPFRSCKRMCCFYTAGEKLLFEVVIESKVFVNPKVDKMRERLKEISDSLGMQLKDKVKMAETELGYKGVFRPGTEQMLTAEIVGDKTEDGKEGKKMQIKLVDYRILQNDFQGG